MQKQGTLYHRPLHLRRRLRRFHPSSAFRQILRQYQNPDQSKLAHSPFAAAACHAPPYAMHHHHHHAPPCATMARNHGLLIQSSAPTLSEEIATVRLKDRYSNGEKTWRATLNVECPKCAKLHATALKKKRREPARELTPKGKGEPRTRGGRGPVAKR